MTPTPLRYRLIALDVDGTLLDSSGSVPPRVREAVRRVREAGAAVTLATGRRFPPTQALARDLGLDTPLIVHNGALIQEAADGAILYHRHLDREAARAAVELARRAGCVPFVHNNAFDGQVVFYEDDPSSCRFPGYFSADDPRFVRLPDVTGRLERDPIRVVAFGDLAAATRLRDALAARPDPRLRIIFWPDAFPGLSIVEVFHPEATKGAALAVLAARLGVPRDAVLAAGDHVNDVEMVAYAGLGVAMGNASSEVKAVARHVAATNDEDGLADVLESLVLGGAA